MFAIPPEVLDGIKQFQTNFDIRLEQDKAMQQTYVALTMSINELTEVVSQFNNVMKNPQEESKSSSELVVTEDDFEKAREDVHSGNYEDKTNDITDSVQTSVDELSDTPPH